MVPTSCLNGDRTRSAARWASWFIGHDPRMTALGASFSYLAVCLEITKK